MPYGTAFPFAFIFADSANPDRVTHPAGYTGTGGTLTVDIGIDNTSANRVEMVTAVQNVVATVNAMVSTVGNLSLGANNNIQPSEIDFESVLLHEVGHSLGLAHCNIGSVAGNPPGITEFTNSTPGVGAMAVFETDNGADNIDGTADDIRGDDVNFNYFKTVDNDPFSIATTVDNSTYTRDIASLPAGDTYSENASRLAGPGLSEAVMQQGSFSDEAQRELHPDDVAGLQFAMSGIDEIQGNADDYTIVLNFVGEVPAGGADIVIDFDNTQTGFAVSSSGGTFIATDHLAITTNSIFFNTNFNWFFNNAPLPVSLVAFDAELKDNEVHLTWSTASEIEHSHFEIERSQDLDTWKKISSVYEHDQEYNSGLKEYSAKDLEVAVRNGDWYYRLVAVSTDNKRSISRIQHISVSPGELNVTVGPMPLIATSCAELYLDVAAAVHFKIVDGMGKAISEGTFSGQIGPNEIDISAVLEQTGHGVYFLVIEAEKNRVIKRMIR